MNETKNNHVGLVIRSIRAKKGFSLRALAKSSGISSNAISKIERGETSPTVASLQQLADALDVHISFLFSEIISRSTILIKSDQRELVESNGTIIQKLGNGISNQVLDPILVDIPPGHGNSDESFCHAGEEYIYCLKGTLEFIVENETYLLKTGDQLLFKASQYHRWRNTSDEKAQIIIIMQKDSEQPYPHKVQ